MGANWQQLGVSLGLSHKELEHLKEIHHNKINDCVREMLEQWKRTQVTGMAMEKLKKALVKEGRKDLAESIGKPDNGMNTVCGMCISPIF